MYRAHYATMMNKTVFRLVVAGLLVSLLSGLTANAKVVSVSSLSFSPDINKISRGNMQLATAVMSHDEFARSPFSALDLERRLTQAPGKILLARVAWIANQPITLFTGPEFTKASSLPRIFPDTRFSQRDHRQFAAESPVDIPSVFSVFGLSTSLTFTMEWRHFTTSDLDKNPTLQHALSAVSSTTQPPQALTYQTAENFNMLFNAYNMIIRYHPVDDRTLVLIDQAVLVDESAIEMADSIPFVTIWSFLKDAIEESFLSLQHSIDSF